MLIPTSKIEELRYSLSPARFAREKLGFNPDPWQEQFLESDSPQIILNNSRQSGKSTSTSVKALHEANYNEGSLTLLISPSLRQSSELFRKITANIKRLKQKPILTEDNKLSLTFENESRIVSLPSSEETIRGFSAVDLLIIDEASRVTDALYKSIRPMLAISQGKLIIMSTPFGKRGFFFNEWESNDNDWERIRVPATQCPRISAEFLDKERKSLGDWWFRQEYMCEFVETTDSVFSYEEVMQSLSPEVEPLFYFDGSDNKQISTDVELITTEY